MSEAQDIIGAEDDGSDRRLPRYAGYPTASHFTAGIGPEQADAWLAALPPGATLAATLHIPFCERLCPFCCCRTQRASDPAAVETYLAALGAEIARSAARLPAGARVVALGWSGGTPTLLSPAQIARLDGALRAALPGARDARLTVEIDADGLDPARIEALAAAGLAEAAIGLQDFDPDVQAAAGRTQDPARVAATVAALRRAGVGAISVELLYGLPLQTVASLAATLEAVLAFAPDRVALAGYAHVPWMAKRQRVIAETSLPDAAARRDQFAFAADRLAAAGYVPCGADLFARPGDGIARAAVAGRLRRDLFGYTAAPVDAVLGFGAASVSRLPQGYLQNVAETGAYEARIAAGASAASRGAALSLEDRVRGRAIEMLLCDLRLDFARLAAEFGDFARLLDAACAAAAERFAGLVERDGAGLTLAAGRPFLPREVARLFDAYARPAAGRA